jgi:CHAD domain-containing protein
MISGFVKLRQVKPVVSGYIRESQILLRKSASPEDKTVHDIRVLMKKTRSLLKLTHEQTDDSFYQRNIDDLKCVGKLLCSWRDSSVYRKALRDLKKENPETFKNLNTFSKLQLLLEKPEPIDEVSPDMKASIEQIDELLNKTIYRIRFVIMSRIDPDILLKKLESTYSKATNAYVRCRNNPKPELIHKFRKKAKDFNYQLFIFRSLSPSTVRNLEKKLETLTINLGKFNDLVQVIKALEYNYDEANNSSSMDVLILRIRAKQDKYLFKVWASSFKLFHPGQKLVNLLDFKVVVT